jgi:hypothetical protein
LPEQADVRGDDEIVRDRFIEDDCRAVPIGS